MLTRTRYSSFEKMSDQKIEFLPTPSPFRIEEDKNTVCRIEFASWKETKKKHRNSAKGMLELESKRLEGKERKKTRRKKKEWLR